MAYRRHALFCTIMASVSSVPLAAAAQSAANVQEVVVTAQRRSERLQDVPLSVTALTAADLNRGGVSSTRDLSLVTPGLRMDFGGINTQPAVRGVSSTVQTPSAEVNVATYIDGVYQANTTNGVYQLPDVRQIEVLKGPQGTLFGRNATGGAILINTLAPDFHQATGMASAGYGRFDTKTFKGFASAPIVEDKVAVSVTGFYERTGGWQHNLLAGGRHEATSLSNQLLRGKIRFKPWEGADFTLAGAYGRINDHNNIKWTLYQGNSALRATGALIASKPNTFAFDFDAADKLKQKSLSLRGDIEAGPGTLTTTTAYQRTVINLLADIDFTPVPIGPIKYHSSFKSFSQEVVYSTKQLGRFHAVGGLFYFTASGGTLPLDIASPVDFAQVIWQDDKTKAYAAFGELTYDVTDRLSLTGGLRYSHERVNAYAAFVLNSPVPPNPIPRLAGAHWSSVTPRVSVLYKATPDTNVYFTYSQGFKSGVFNTTGFQTTPVNPEKVRAYEIGIKTFPARNASLNAAAFYYKYIDLQVPTIFQVGVSIQQALTNAASAKIYGVEVSGTWNPTDAFRLSFGGAYLHARYDKFPNASINIPTGFGGNVTVSKDVSGNTMIRSPTFSGNVTGDYTWRTHAGEFEASGILFYTSKSYFDPGDRVVQSGYANVNAALAWRPNDSGLELRIWGRNLTNKVTINSYLGGTLYDVVHYTPPRTFGGEVTYRF